MSHQPVMLNQVQHDEKGEGRHQSPNPVRVERRRDTVLLPGKAIQRKDRASTSSAQTGIGGFMKGPVKRSVTIAGHETSISLEPIFWTALRDAAAEEGLPVNALVARIDAERIASDDPPNLGSAIRVWLYARLSNTRA